MSLFSYKNAILNNINSPIENVEKIVKEEKKENDYVKKKAINIFVKKDSIPSQEDILKLCSHGMYIKIKNIHNSHFTEENIKFYIKYMHNKINEIKVWKKEEKNMDELSQKRFKVRIDNIYKTINVIKSKHYEYYNIDNIMEDKDGKWVKVGKINNI